MEKVLDPRDTTDLTELSFQFEDIRWRYGETTRDRVMQLMMYELDMTPDAALFQVLKQDAEQREFDRRYPDYEPMIGEASDVNEMAA